MGVATIGPASGGAGASVCVFCGLLCDDVRVRREAGRLQAEANGCPRAEAGYSAWSGTLECSVDGRPAGTAEAVAAAVRLLAGARRPLVAGLAADVDAQRAALALADRLGAVIDHGAAAGLMRTLSVLQDTGAMTATLAEVRTRADLLVLVGRHTVVGTPRLLERVGAPEGRALVCLGWTPEEGDLAGWTGAPPTVLDGDLNALPEIAAALRALLAGRRMTAAAVGGVPADALADLATRLAAARYGVIAWAAEAFAGPAPELAVHQLVELVRDLNRRTRCSGLPLGGAGNAVGANQVLHWQAGTGLGTAFGADGPDWAPLGNRWRDVLVRGEADALLWLDTLGGGPVPAPAGVPVVALVAPGARFEGAPAVVLAAGRPGIDHDGWAFRTDGVVALPLTAPDSPPANAAPAAAQLLNDILATVEGLADAA